MTFEIFGRFDAKPGMESELQRVILEVMAPTRAEPGCREIYFCRGLRDRARFIIHSKWDSEAAFDAHAEMPHVKKFVASVADLITHPMDVTRAEVVDEASR